MDGRGRPRLERAAESNAGAVADDFTLTKAGHHVRERLAGWGSPENPVYLQADAANNYDGLYRQSPHIRAEVQDTQFSIARVGVRDCFPRLLWAELRVSAVASWALPIGR